MEHIRHIIEKLNDNRLIQAVFGHQRSFLRFIQLFIVKRRAGHQLQQRKQHQKDDQQRHQRNKDAFQNIFFQTSFPPLYSVVTIWNQWFFIAGR